MNRMKTFGLAAVAALALTAMVGISSASAAEFHSNAASASLVGNQSNQHTFTSGGSSVTCNTATFTGTGSATKTSVEQDMHPAYSGCTAFGFASATVNTAGCNYEFSANTSTVNLEDCTNKGVTIHVSAFFGTTTCHVFIKEQGGINKNTIATGKSTDTELKVVTASDNIEYEVLDSTGFCPLTDGEIDDDATYSGNTTVKANNGSATIWKE